MSRLMTCPGTRMGKPGGYGMTNIADTTVFKSVDGQTYTALPRCKVYHAPDPCVRRARVLRRGDFRYRVLWSGVGDPSWRPG